MTGNIMSCSCKRCQTDEQEDEQENDLWKRQHAFLCQEIQITRKQRNKWKLQEVKLLLLFLSVVKVVSVCLQHVQQKNS